MEIQTRVDGFRARVLIDFYFENDKDQQYEGTFKLRLPNGASPYFLAFGQSRFESVQQVKAPAKASFSPQGIMEERAQAWIEPKEARMVPRVTAARAYTETVHRRVDPALMEWAGAGVFNARIFPIQPRKLHRIVVGYDMNLSAIGDDLELRLPIPAGIPSASVDIDAQSSGKKPIVLSPRAEVVKLADRLLSHLENVSGEVVTLRVPGAAAASSISGSDAKTGSYFAARAVPNLPNTAGNQSPTRAVFAVDTSLSSNPDKFNVWLALLEATLNNNRDNISEFAVLFFNIDSHWYRPRFLKNSASNVEAMMTYARSLALEGATDLSTALSEATKPDWLHNNALPWSVFLLSDGAVTWGESEAFAMASKLAAPTVNALYAYRTGLSGSDNDMLDHLAREGGGAVFSVVGESEVQSASTAHTTRPWQIESVQIAGASDVLIAGRPRALFSGQRLLIAGRGKLEKGAYAELALRQGRAARILKVPLGQNVESPLAARAYGQLAVGQLEDFLGSTQGFAEAYARHFRVTGKTTSLLMLESEADYQRFGIQPQDDAGTVEQTRVSTLLANAIDQLASLLGDAKVSFLHANKRSLSADLATILQALPSRAFDVRPGQLSIKEHRKSSLPQAIVDQLARGKADYDALSVEAERRRQKLSASDGLKALSSLIELNPGDGVLARDVGFQAMEWGLPGHAYHLFRRVAHTRPYEPQSLWAMALALREAGKNDLALAYFELVLAGTWDARFGPFKRIVKLDYLHFLRERGKSLHPQMANLANKRLEELGASFGVETADLLVTIMWNTDNTDVDLHVVEPSGEEAYYSHPNTRSGGKLSQDVTQGYGPELFIHKRAPRGTYTVRAKYFASDSNRASARTKVYANVYQGWGSPQERVQRQVVTLEYGKEMHDIAKIKIP
jgi:hypothetical protein